VHFDVCLRAAEPADRDRRHGVSGGGRRTLAICRATSWHCAGRRSLVIGPKGEQSTRSLITSSKAQGTRVRSAMPRTRIARDHYRSDDCREERTMGNRDFAHLSGAERRGTERAMIRRSVRWQRQSGPLGKVVRTGGIRRPGLENTGAVMGRSLRCGGSAGFAPAGGRSSTRRVDHGFHLAGLDACGHGRPAATIVLEQRCR